MLMKHLSGLTKALLTSLFFVCVAQAQASCKAPQLCWVAGDLPPFAWQGSRGPEGYAHELAVLMAQRLGRHDRVEYYPWARAVRMTEEADNLGVFPLARTPDRESKFRWLILLMHVRYEFVGRAQAETYTLEQLRTARVGVLRGSPIIKNLQAEKFSTIVEAKDYKDLLRMLRSDIISVIYAGGPMLQAAIEQAGNARQDYKVHTSLGEADLYMGSSLRLPEAEAERWLQAYQQLLADGTVARLQQRYFR